MNHTFKAIPVTDDVYWVGAIDWNIRDFHGYLTGRGSSYNAYLVMADQITLIDAVKGPFFGEMMQRISSVVNPARIDIIVSNHSEMDHSGCLNEAIGALSPRQVYASTMGAKTLNREFHCAREITPVKDGETLSLGNMSLTFVETKMLHWPDSMFSYLPEREVLFSQDAFGMHLATTERFDDQVDDWLLQYEGSRYFANILTPFSPLVLKLLGRVGGMNLALKYICPDHGPIWRKDLTRILGLYEQWATQRPTDKAVIVYDTMWQATAKMAQAYSEGLQAAGARVRVMKLGASHRSDVAAEVLDAGALLVGSPTINNQMFPTVADVLTYLRGLKPQNLIGTAFGAYGWSGEAVGQIAATLGEMKVEMAAEPIKVQYAPTDEELAQCYEAGRQIGDRLMAACSC